uniref:Uncharacterized protein n=1 Tax=Timema poppense TaxID=170557 RepID=A0A7R9CQX8_TIMPO|nr:unnamed protein product [Timema poppensis]
MVHSTSPPRLPFPGHISVDKLQRDINYSTSVADWSKASLSRYTGLLMTEESGEKVAGQVFLEFQDGLQNKYSIDCGHNIGSTEEVAGSNLYWDGVTYSLSCVRSTHLSVFFAVGHCVRLGELDWWIRGPLISLSLLMVERLELESGPIVLKLSYELVDANTDSDTNTNDYMNPWEEITKFFTDINEKADQLYHQSKMEEPSGVEVKGSALNDEIDVPDFSQIQSAVNSVKNFVRDSLEDMTIAQDTVEIIDPVTRKTKIVLRLILERISIYTKTVLERIILMSENLSKVFGERGISTRSLAMTPPGHYPARSGMLRRQLRTKKPRTLFIDTGIQSFQDSCFDLLSNRPRGIMVSAPSYQPRDHGINFPLLSWVYFPKRELSQRSPGSGRRTLSNISGTGVARRRGALTYRTVIQPTIQSQRKPLHLTNFHGSRVQANRDGLILYTRWVGGKNLADTIMVKMQALKNH